MKRLIDLSYSEAREFLLKATSYSNIKLPLYYDFQPLLLTLSEEVGESIIKDLWNKTPAKESEVNHSILSNKDGHYAWRPFELIHPVLYVALVHRITRPENWSLIVNRIKECTSSSNIVCCSLPVLSENDQKSDQDYQILTWWESVEQQSIQLSLEFSHVVHTDITDCYGSIYTHSIAWALHGKAESKDSRGNLDFVGNVIDTHIQMMRNGQTNGIPQGSTLMDFVAEIVLCSIDEVLFKRIQTIGVHDYKILRYRDDYRVFTNDPTEGHLILKVLAELLAEYGMKVNPNKTESSSNIITSSIKPDKRYWIENKRKAENKQKWLIQLHLLSEKFPNSGTLENQMREFLEFVSNDDKKIKDVQTQIGLIAEIIYRNPRVCSIGVSIVSILLEELPTGERNEILSKIRLKFGKVPNPGYINIWLFRLFVLHEDTDFNEPLNQLVINPKTEIWNNSWLKNPVKRIMESTSIVSKSILEGLENSMSKEEVEEVLKSEGYHEYL